MQQPQAAPEAHPDLHTIDVDGRTFFVVGTAHISRESAELVREVIEREHPDRVCLELDRQRYEALANPTRWDQLDLKQLIRSRQLAPLVANLMLAAYQKKLGDLAKARGVTNWEENLGTYAAIGEGLGQAKASQGLVDTFKSRLAPPGSANSADKQATIQKGYDSKK